MEEENVERGIATGSCKPPDQVQSPLERVQKYVKEQSDSLQPSEAFGNSDTSPRISELNVSAHSYIPSSTLPTPTAVSQEPATLHPPRLTYTSVLPRATSLDESFPHHGFRQSNLVYSTPFSRINPTSSSVYPRVTIPTPLSHTNDAMHLQRNPHLTVPSQPIQSDDPLTRLADLLSERQSRDKLPLPEPEIFRGDLMHFPRWIRSFETIVENQTQKTSERLFYLAKYTAGEARDAISGYISQNNMDAYDRAKSLLWKRYGNPFLVADAYKKRIYSWPKIAPHDSTGLRKFSDFLHQTLSAMQSTTFLGVLNDPTENQRMAKKLPIHMINRWSRQVDRYIFERDSNIATAADLRLSYPSFAEFCKFVEKEARISCNPVISVQAFKAEEIRNRRPADPTKSAFKTGATEDNQEKTKRILNCLYCKKQNDHDLSECPSFTEIPYPDRHAFVISKRLCWGCLKWGHINKECRRKRSCKTCNGVHPTSLHEDKPKESKEAGKEEKHPEASVSHRADVRTGKTNVSVSHSLIVPVWVRHDSAPEEVLVYALLDEQSDACFMKTTVANALNLEGMEVNLKLSTMLGEENITCQKISGLVMRGVNSDGEISVPKTYIREMIPAQRSQIPDPDSAKLWPHLQQISNEIMKPLDDVEIGLVIGANCPRAIKPREVIPGKDDDPYAIRTALGWGIIGKITSSEEVNGVANVNKIEVREVKDGKNTKRCAFAFKTKTKEIIITPKQVNKMLEQDFSEIVEERPLSYEDRRFVDIVSKGIHRNLDCHYEIPLPLKNSEYDLPNNREQPYIV